MNKLLAVLALCTVLQIVHCQDEALTKCLQKLTQGINSLQSTKGVPKCVNEEQLKKALEQTKYFKTIFEEVIKACTTDGGMMGCLSKIMEIVSGKQEEIKQCASGSIEQFMGAFYPCMGQLSDLEEYIRRGCEDKQ